MGEFWEELDKTPSLKLQNFQHKKICSLSEKELLKQKGSGKDFRRMVTPRKCDSKNVNGVWRKH